MIFLVSEIKLSKALDCNCRKKNGFSNYYVKIKWVLPRLVTGALFFN